MSSDTPRRPDRRDPSWEPSDVVVKFYVPRSFAAALDSFASELDLSKSLFVREAVRRGVPLLVHDVRELLDAGLKPSTHIAGAARGGRHGTRGALGEGVVSLTVVQPRAPKAPSDARDPADRG